MPLQGLLRFAWLLVGSCALAQTVQPVISEYQLKADGKFALTNGTLAPMVVVLEPKSFSITADGQGVFRPLDRAIHVELSAMSARLEPGQAYYVFYKAHADQLAAWFTVYSTFSSVQHHPGLDVRIMLPHTVYLYQKHPLNKEEINIFDTSHYVVAQGAGVLTTLRNTGVFAFAGATSTEFDSPLFEGARAENPAFLLFLDRRLTQSLSLSSKMIFSRQITAIEGLDWTAGDRLKIGFSGGVGSNQPYGAASLDFRRKWIIVQAAYVEAGNQFHRAVVEAPLLSEPDRENVVVTLKPARYFSISGGRQNFLTPLSESQNNVRSSIDQATANLDLAGVGLVASFYHSTYLGDWNDSTAYSAGRDFTHRVHGTANYLESRPNNAPKSRAFIANFSEILTPRWDVTEVLTRSHGQTSVSFGGGFLSNLISASAQYETYYVPQRNASPFVQAMIIDLQIHLFRGATLHGGSFVAPDGSVRYTADASGIMTREATGGRESVQHYSIGSSILRGRVVDSKGQPVEGAALLIDNVPVFTDSDGRFFLRERRPHTHKLQVLADKFLNGGSYRVQSAPATVKATKNGAEPEAVIVVRRVAGSTGGQSEL